MLELEENTNEPEKTEDSSVKNKHDNNTKNRSIIDKCYVEDESSSLDPLLNNVLNREEKLTTIQEEKISDEKKPDERNNVYAIVCSNNVRKEVIVEKNLSTIQEQNSSGKKKCNEKNNISAIAPSNDEDCNSKVPIPNDDSNQPGDNVNCIAVYKIKQDKMQRCLRLSIVK